MLSSSQSERQPDMGVYLGTRMLLTELWRKDAPQNAITWYAAQKQLLSFESNMLPLSAKDSERAILSAPKDILPCLLSFAGGLVLKPDARRFNQLVHEAPSYSPWEAVVRLSDTEFELTPVSFAPLGRRAALKIAGGIIEAVCPLCPFEGVCNRTIKPHTGSLYGSALNYYPGIIVDI